MGEEIRMGTERRPIDKINQSKGGEAEIRIEVYGLSSRSLLLINTMLPRKGVKEKSCLWTRSPKERDVGYTASRL